MEEEGEGKDGSGAAEVAVVAESALEEEAV